MPTIIRIRPTVSTSTPLTSKFVAYRRIAPAAIRSSAPPNVIRLPLPAGRGPNPAGRVIESVDDRRRARLRDAGPRRALARGRQPLGIEVRLDARGAPPSHADDVRALVLVRRPVARPRPDRPLDRDDRAPRRPAQHHVRDAEVVALEHGVQALEPPPQGIAGVTLTSEGALARKDVVDVGGGPGQEGVVVIAESLEEASHLPSDDRPIHLRPPGRLRRARGRPSHAAGEAVLAPTSSSGRGAPSATARGAPG